MNDPLAERIYGIPWVVLAGVGLAVALIYAFVPAGERMAGAQWLLLRWGHTVAWVFLAAAAFVRSKVSGLPLETAAPIAGVGGLIYVALMLTTMMSG